MDTGWEGAWGGESGEGVAGGGGAGEGGAGEGGAGEGEAGEASSEMETGNNDRESFEKLTSLFLSFSQDIHQQHLLLCQHFYCCTKSEVVVKLYLIG